jgi:Glycerophosphoryl diester phosphodiesterase family
MILLSSLLLLVQTPLLTRAHSHNDYMQERPLDEALENGFNSIEVDVFPVDGELLVAHNQKDIKPEKTIQSMYLNKLSARAKANRGAIYPGSKTTFWVLVDVKKNGEEAYRTFKTILDRYPELKPSGRKSKVRFVISGYRAFDLIAADNGKWAGIDGEWKDMGKKYTVEQMPWISGNWATLFPDKGEREFPSDHLTKMETMVKAIHAEHRLVRFWGTPDGESTWQIQWRAGVDLINTDHISALRKWELAQMR